MVACVSTATDMLAAYLAAESAVLLGKQASVGGRSFSYENLAEIREGRKEWERRVAAENAAAVSAPSFGGMGYSLGRMDK